MPDNEPAKPATPVIGSYELLVEILFSLDRLSPGCQIAVEQFAEIVRAAHSIAAALREIPEGGDA